jgi:periplasmic protein TonB
MQRLPIPMAATRLAYRAWIASILFHCATLSTIWSWQGGGGGSGSPGSGLAGGDSMEVSLATSATGEQVEEMPLDQMALIGPAEKDLAGAAASQAVEAPTVEVQAAETIDENLPVVNQPPSPTPLESQEKGLDISEPVDEHSSPAENQPMSDAAGDGSVKDASDDAGMGDGDGSPSDPAFDINSIVYPAAARQAMIQGTVVLRVQISRDGRVADVSIVQSSGYAILDSAAGDAVRAWRGHPARRGGEAVDSSVLLPVIFRLR